MLYEPVPMREEVRRNLTLILGLLALLFAATVTLGVFLAGKIFTPIAALQGGTRKVIAGELEFKLEPGAPDEIGELVESFNTMTAALRDARRGLLERQRYLAAVLDNIATGVMATDRDGKIITVNPSGERILGVSGSEVVGKRPDAVFGEGLAPLRELFSGEGQEVREAELALHSGESARTLKAVVASLVEGGERLGTVVVFDDLTELIRSKKLAAWVEMARQIAHEVKNPLTPIKLSAQLMKRAYEAGSEDFGGIFKSGVDTVIQQTEILRRIATEFSSFGKAMRLSPEAVPLGAFLGEIVFVSRRREGRRAPLVRGRAHRAGRPGGAPQDRRQPHRERDRRDAGRRRGVGRRPPRRHDGTDQRDRFGEGSLERVSGAALRAVLLHENERHRSRAGDLPGPRPGDGRGDPAQNREGARGSRRPSRSPSREYDDERDPDTRGCRWLRPQVLARGARCAACGGPASATRQYVTR